MSRLSLIQDLLNTMSERGLSLLSPAAGSAPSVESLIDLCDVLISNRSEASGVAYVDKGSIASSLSVRTGISQRVKRPRRRSYD